LACIFSLSWLLIWIYFSLFLAYHILSFLAYEDFWERHMINEWSNYLVDGKNMFLHNSQCKRQQFYLWVYVCLDHGCMTRISTRVTKIWQSSMLKQVAYD
jgi:hypothetical protein